MRGIRYFLHAIPFTSEGKNSIISRIRYGAIMFGEHVNVQQVAARVV